MFRKKIETVQNPTKRLTEFNYIKNDDIYMDSACQSVRPTPVINALESYYKTYNACGGRVKYKWGQKVDSEIEETRELVVDYLGLSQKNYVCSFTLNTTYGINLILSQLPTGLYEKIITSEIEHNSVFLPTIELAKRLGIERKVLKRSDDGCLIYSKDDLIKSIIVLNSVSNIDGRSLKNIRQLVIDTHELGGIVVIDAAQTMAHYRDLITGCNADAICFSAHKMYSASLGVIVVTKDLLKKLDKKFIGGGMVASVSEQNYSLLPDDMSSWLEPGLQSYGEIISLKSAIKWLNTVKPYGKNPLEYIDELSEKLFNGLSQIPGLTMVNKSSSSVISVYSKKVDAHRLAIFLSASGIMVRSGYFCCHYYLLENLKMPPLLRFSVGLHTTNDDITKTIEIMKKITKG
ncbi:MAG: aminotransferase class V-fold PLP-dependent enzyme [Candidatus Saccharibacteria bacterium]